MAHVNATKESMPVGIVGLGFPQVDEARFWCRTRAIDVLMHTQHFFMLIVDLMVADEEVAPEATAHELQDIIAPLILQCVQEFAKNIGFLRGQCPLGHFDIGGGGDVDASQRGIVAERIRPGVWYVANRCSAQVR